MASLTTRTIVLLVIMLIVIVLSAYLVYTIFLSGRTSLTDCKSIMFNQCIACVSGSAGTNCMSEGLISCGCNDCNLRYISEYQDPRIASKIAECAKELEKIGITVDSYGDFKTVECNKIGVAYTVHCAGSCKPAPNNNPDDPGCK
jgi:hypothetical protein